MKSEYTNTKLVYIKNFTIYIHFTKMIILLILVPLTTEMMMVNCEVSYNGESMNSKIVPHDKITGDVEVIHLSKNQLTTLNTNEFSGYHQLKEVYLDSNLLADIQPDAFKNTIVNILDLTLNHLTNIPDLSAINETLVKLDIEENQLTTIGEQLADFIALREISFKKNQISYVSSSAFCKTKLQKLSFWHNQLTFIPDLKCVQSTIKYLELANNLISSIPREYFPNFTLLTNLGLANNQINKIERGTFKGMLSLRNLHLVANPLKILEDDVFYDTSLAYVYMSKTDLTKFPNFSPVQKTIVNIGMNDLWIGISNFDNFGFKEGDFRILRNLFLVGANGSTIPFNNFSLASSTTKLNIRCIGSCSFTGPDKLFKSLSSSKLTYVQLNDMGLTNIPSNTFSEAGKKLQTVNFDNNPLLGNLHPKIYESFRTVVFLMLKNTGMTIFPIFSSGALITLEELYIDQNPLEIFEGKRVLSLHSLKILSLTNSLNKLTSIPDISPLWDNHSLNLLLLTEVVCTCHNRWIIDRMKKDLQQRMIKMTPGTPCSGPLQFVGKTVKNINSTSICLDSLSKSEMDEVSYNVSYYEVKNVASNIKCASTCIKWFDQCAGFHYDHVHKTCNVSGTHYEMNIQTKSALCQRKGNIGHQYKCFNKT